MTSIQVQYWQLQEQKRANAANEAIKAKEAQIKEREAEASRKQAEAATQQAANRKREVDIREVESKQRRTMDQIDYLFDIPNKLFGSTKAISEFSTLMDGFVTLFA